MRAATQPCACNSETLILENDRNREIAITRSLTMMHLLSLIRQDSIERETNGWILYINQTVCQVKTLSLR